MSRLADSRNLPLAASKSVRSLVIIDDLTRLIRLLVTPTLTPIIS
ncbi:MAG: hypothetical protein ACLRWM_01430 [Streptococcus sp.]